MLSQLKLRLRPIDKFKNCDRIIDYIKVLTKHAEHEDNEFKRKIDPQNRIELFIRYVIDKYILLIGWSMLMMLLSIMIMLGIGISDDAMSLLVYCYSNLLLTGLLSQFFIVHLVATIFGVVYIVLSFLVMLKISISCIEHSIFHRYIPSSDVLYVFMLPTLFITYVITYIGCINHLYDVHAN